LEVRVGKKGSGLTTFMVHKSLITGYSEFFKKRTTAMADQSWEESVVMLPEANPDIFRLYLHLIYRDRLATKGPDEWLKLCRLYVLAEKLHETRAKNRIIDGMHALFTEIVTEDPVGLNVHKVLPAAATTKLYQGTRNHNPARKILVDFYADCGNAVWLQTVQGQLPTDFVRDVAVSLMQKRPSLNSSPMKIQASSFYHESNQSNPTTGRTTPNEVETTPTEVKTAQGKSGETIMERLMGSTKRKEAELKNMEGKNEIQRTLENTGGKVSH
jgi:hypothetical protein